MRGVSRGLSPRLPTCLLIDAYLPGMSGLELLKKLHDGGHRVPSIMITGNSDVPMAVEAMKAGALDFIEKPIGREELIASIERALELSQDSSKLQEWRELAATHLAGLTPRQREVMERVLAGHPSKNIAADLGISQRTVENHRASIMKRTGSKSLPALARWRSSRRAGRGRDNRLEMFAYDSVSCGPDSQPVFLLRGDLTPRRLSPPARASAFDQRLNLPA